ncbi:hypothetical protein PG993_011708 [Apiospora rasikravindrae]|uniref:DUF7735 domain-containing protein n=1 Tax=Apiospora rasikravindrae TaxID=990691 RepID=A0ABR1S0D6_9PEZI
MYNQVLLSAALAGLASTVGATYNHAAANQLRDLTQPAHVVPRQPAESGSSDCAESAMKLFNELPQPTGALLSYYESATAAEMTGTAVPTNLGQVCASAASESIPSSLSAPLSSYESTLVGWYSSHTSDIAQLMSVCSADPILSSAESLLDQITKEPACSSLLASATGALASPTASGSGAGAAQTSTPAKAAAPKPTAMVAGAVAAAGFLGAVAML